MLPKHLTSPSGSRVANLAVILAASATASVAAPAQPASITALSITLGCLCVILLAAVAVLWATRRAKPNSASLAAPLIVPGALMIEPTESEPKEELDLFIEAMRSIAEEGEEDPQIVLDAPHSTRVSRLDETAAARKPVLRWKPHS